MRQRSLRLLDVVDEDFTGLVRRWVRKKDQWRVANAALIAFSRYSPDRQRKFLEEVNRLWMEEKQAEAGAEDVVGPAGVEADDEERERKRRARRKGA